MKKNKKEHTITLQEKNDLDQQIRILQKEIDYDTRDFTIELLINKFKRNDFFIPDYQRNFIWNDSHKTLFLESVFLGLPIPFMFFADCDDGKQEIIDGAQRMQTLVEFSENRLKITGLKKITKLNGFYFNDLSDAQQRKFLNKAMRVIVLREDTPSSARQDLFYRINTTGLKASDSEIRRGSYPGKLTSFIEKCAEDSLFKELAPMSIKRENRYERFEFILRFFAYLNSYNEFEHDVKDFLNNYLVQNLNTFNERQFSFEFNRMLRFVKDNFPCGFAKTKTSKSTPRVRFEAISVGVALALRENPNLSINNLDWLETEEFKLYTTSDASNNQGKLKQRIEYVKEQLLKDN
ncbi:DUF262 domain-containing protein [Megamonas funiformis]|uniref:DUF262 domain-containing protein n=1 Tax=Megamonas funiformis TaxID=437897 RepID=UPI00402599AA